MTPPEKLLLSYVNESIAVVRERMAYYWSGGELENARREYRALVRLREVREGLVLRLSVLDEIRTAAA